MARVRVGVACARVGRASGCRARFQVTWSQAPGATWRAHGVSADMVVSLEFDERAPPRSCAWGLGFRTAWLASGAADPRV